MFTRVVSLLVLFCGLAVAQGGLTADQHVVVDPSGACAAGARLRYNTVNGNFWGCDGGVWRMISSGQSTYFDATRPCVSVRSKGAKGDWKTGSSATITNTSTTVTCPGCAFVQADKGKNIYGFRSGLSTLVNTTIASVTNGTTVELTAAAIGSAAGDLTFIGQLSYRGATTAEAWLIGGGTTNATCIRCRFIPFGSPTNYAGVASSSGTTFTFVDSVIQAGGTGKATNIPAGATLVLRNTTVTGTRTETGPVYVVSDSAPVSTGIKFTITGCSADTTVGGATAGTFVSRTTGACTVTITMNGATGLTAPNGWHCTASDRTTPANLYDQSDSTTTTATLTGTTVTGDVISFACVGY